jgi:hypothetical protein
MGDLGGYFSLQDRIAELEKELAEKDKQHAQEIKKLNDELKNKDANYLKQIRKYKVKNRYIEFKQVTKKEKALKLIKKAKANRKFNTLREEYQNIADILRTTENSIKKLWQEE